MAHPSESLRSLQRSGRRCHSSGTPALSVISIEFGVPEPPGTVVRDPPFDLEAPTTGAHAASSCGVGGVRRGGAPSQRETTTMAFLRALRISDRPVLARRAAQGSLAYASAEAGGKREPLSVRRELEVPGRAFQATLLKESACKLRRDALEGGDGVPGFQCGMPTFSFNRCQAAFSRTRRRPAPTARAFPSRYLH